MSIPSWPDAAKKALSVFYSSWNDIDVFVEDTASYAETFYIALINNALQGKAKVNKVFPLGDKNAVVSACQGDTQKSARRRIYLIDGDLDFVCGKPAVRHPRMYQHAAYAIENYLITEKAITNILHEENSAISEQDVRNLFDFGNWIAELSDLTELFVCFAMTWLIAPEYKTVKFGIGPFLKKVNGRDELDSNKVAAFCSARRAELVTASTAAKVDTTEVHIRQQLLGKRLTDYVAAREFLFLPMKVRATKLGMRLSCSPESMYVRMAKATDLLHSHPHFVSALMNTAQGKTI
ncbi:MAG: DUF4435 domain-containing protein [Nitrosomonadales bacterium]|nr:DUF4435 domain-containing protein [Nitrosomonadales bacterium]